MNGKAVIEQFHDLIFTQLESERQVKLSKKTKSLIKRASETWGSLGVALIFYFIREYGATDTDAILMAKKWLEENGGPEIK